MRTKPFSSFVLGTNWKGFASDRFRKQAVQFSRLNFNASVLCKSSTLSNSGADSKSTVGIIADDEEEDLIVYLQKRGLISNITRYTVLMFESSSVL